MRRNPASDAEGEVPDWLYDAEQRFMAEGHTRSEGRGAVWGGGSYSWKTS